jgi:hypothetical protein
LKLLGKDVSGRDLVQIIERRLRARGLLPQEVENPPANGVEPKVDPLSFNLFALEEHADPTRQLPLETHRGGLGGRAVLLAKWAFRKSCQVFINEALARQRAFNGHVRDSYAQLSAEVMKLRSEMEQSRKQRESRSGKPKPKRKTTRLD